LDVLDYGDSLLWIEIFFGDIFKQVLI
jgi:hypothetical protein